MIDILILALPVDRQRAEAILDTLHEEKVAGAFRTRFVTEHPMDAGWSEVVRFAESCPCVIFCWSVATSGADAEPVRALGLRVLAANHAISVELDRDSRPATMSGSCYPLYGWHSQPAGWGRFVFGNNALKQITAATARKASGQDPPPPQAYWRLVRKQAWAALLGLLAILGTTSTLWGFYNDQNIAKLIDTGGRAKYQALKAQRSCVAVRAYLASPGDGPWQQDARGLLAKCHNVRKERLGRDDPELPVFGMTRDEAVTDAWEKCEGYAQNARGRLTAFELEHFVAEQRATARCHVVVPTSVDVEVME